MTILKIEPGVKIEPGEDMDMDPGAGQLEVKVKQEVVVKTEPA
jgi:hypothetical protein